MRGTWKTTGGGGGGLVPVLVVIGVVVLIGSGTASAAAGALASLLVMIAIVLGSLAVLAVAAGIAWLVWRARHDRPGRPVARSAVVQLPREAPPPVEASQPRPAIGPAREIESRALHLHFHGLPGAEQAEVIRQALSKGTGGNTPT
jgi:hypothetical protein